MYTQCELVCVIVSDPGRVVQCEYVNFSSPIIYDVISIYNFRFGGREDFHLGILRYMTERVWVGE